MDILEQTKSSAAKMVRSDVYRLIEPYVFKPVSLELPVNKNDVVVRPTFGSICAADLRYYTGNRRPEALRKKLPMALIHEAIGEVVDPNGHDLQPGQRVVLVPNVPGYLYDPVRFPSPKACCRACGESGVGENHCANCRFLSSGHDGFLMSRVSHTRACVVPIPDGVPDRLATMSELASVAYNAVKRVQLPENAVFAIFGDGPMGYITAVVIQKMFDLPPERLFVVGKDDEKLAHYDFATCVNLTADPGLDALPPFDFGFECVGGAQSMKAIDDAIRIAQPGAEIFLMGVSETPIPLNTRDVLEKGLAIRGVSRSPRQDYPVVLEMMRDPVFKTRLDRVIAPVQPEFQNIDSLLALFNLATRKTLWGKIVFGFNLS